MARSVNKVTLVGNLGGDPETKYTQSGQAVTRISLATTSSRKDRDGNVQERTDWHRVVFFGKGAEIAGEYLRKGSQIYVEGTLRYDKFTGQDGVEKFTTDIIANDFLMLGSRADGGGEQRQQRTQQSDKPANGQNRQAPPSPVDDFNPDDFGDDTPF